MKKNNKGFTLAELLIVVAIIAVLVAIAIPVFTTQLEKSRESTDLANVRSAYAECVTDFLTNGNKSYAGKSITVAAQQTQSGWQGGVSTIGTSIGSQGKITVANHLKPDSYTVKIDKTGAVTVS